MSGPPEQFARVAGRVNLSLLAAKQVVVIGVGSVGSQVAKELANDGVGHLRLIDHDIFEEANLPRHALTRAHLGMNKAEGTGLFLASETPTLKAEAVPLKIDDSISDTEFDQLVRDVDLIVATTDDHVVQRRIGRRALSLDIPAIFPGLYARKGGEVFVQRSPRHPCFLCWDGHRPVTQALRGVSATNADILAIIQLAVWLCEGILDPRSDYAQDFLVAAPGDERPPQLFVQNDLALTRQTIEWVENCPSCAVGPPPRTSPPPPRPFTQPPPTPLPSNPNLLTTLARDIFRLIATIIGAIVAAYLVLVGVALYLAVIGAAVLAACAVALELLVLLFSGHLVPL